MRARRFVAGVIIAAVVLGAAGRASAKDMCFTLPGLSGGVGYALKSFTAPGKNLCKPVTGFSTIAAFLLDGTMCRTADGTTLRLTLNGNQVVSGPVGFQGGCTIPFPSLTGGTCLGTFDGGSTTIGFTSSIGDAVFLDNVTYDGH